DERVDGKIWNLDSKVYKTIYNYFKRKEKEFLTKSDYTISLTSNGKREIESWDTIDQEKVKIKVIPCCVNLDLFDPSKISLTEKQTLKKSLNLNEDAFILGYVGSIGTWYMLPEMLDYFK